MKIIIKEIKDCSECPYKKTSRGQGFDDVGCSLCNYWIINNKPHDKECPLPDSKDYIITKKTNNMETEKNYKQRVLECLIKATKSNYQVEFKDTISEVYAIVSHKNSLICEFFVNMVTPSETVEERVSLFEKMIDSITNNNK